MFHKYQIWDKVYSLSVSHRMLMREKGILCCMVPKILPRIKHTIILKHY